MAQRKRTTEQDPATRTGANRNRRQAIPVNPAAIPAEDPAARMAPAAGDPAQARLYPAAGMDPAAMQAARMGTADPAAMQAAAPAGMGPAGAAYPGELPGQMRMDEAPAGMTVSVNGQQTGPGTGKESAFTRRRMDEERIRKATETLRKYKAGKASVDKRIIASQEWWKLRNWRQIEREDGIQGASSYKSNTATLWNCIVGKHADMMDAYPEPMILPRMEDDREEARRLSEIVPVVLQANGFEDVYSNVVWQKMLEGTGCYGVFWDRSRLNGLGDVAIRKINLLNLFWEPGIENIQESRNVFLVTLMDNDRIEQTWPQARGKIGDQAATVSRYLYDDNIDTTGKSLVVDWYYHTWEGGRKVLQYCKFSGSAVLYCTEDDPELAERGLYDDGDYPFVMDPLYTVEGSPAGYGYIDIGRDTQRDIDTISQALVLNAVVTATPRYFMRQDGGVNEEEFADISKPIVHVSGNLGQDTLLQVQSAGIQGNCISVMQQKCDELKFITGNTDVQNGQAPGGVTSAAGLAALQQQAGRSSRDCVRSGYRAFNRVVMMVIERIRQFYDAPRTFRILGERGEEGFVSYDNSGIRPQPQGQDFGMEMGYRLPVFDVEVHAAKENGYTRQAQNDFALQMLGSGVFSPMNIDQSLLCLDLMDFKEKETVQQKLQEMGGMQQSLQQLFGISQMLAAEAGDAQTLAQLQQMAAAMGMQQAAMPAAGGQEPESGMNEDDRRTNTILTKAAARAQDAATGT